MSDASPFPADLQARLRAEFAALAERTWLNTAHQGALPLSAARAAEGAIGWKRQPWELTTERFSGMPDGVRQRLARLLSAAPDEIVLANSSSHGIHLLANGFPWRPGDEVLVVRGDFPSTYLPFLGLRRRGVAVRFVEPRGAAVTPEEIDEAIGPRTRLLCTTWVHSFNGHAVDARGIGEVCRRRGVRFVLNASQAVGARPLAVHELAADAVTGVGFKWLCGPYGTGFCWLRRELLAELEYNQIYWLAYQTADDLTRGGDPDLERDVGARRYDIFGTANFFQYAAWTASLDLVLAAGVDVIAAHDQELVERLVAGLDPDRFELGSPRRGPERSTLVFLTHRQNPERNEAIHAGLTAAGIHTSLRRGRIRIAPHFYNTAKEIDRVLEVLASRGQHTDSP